jgi:hypothetical protein
VKLAAAAVESGMVFRNWYRWRFFCMNSVNCTLRQQKRPQSEPPETQADRDQIARHTKTQKKANVESIGRPLNERIGEDREPTDHQAPLKRPSAFASRAPSPCPRRSCGREYSARRRCRPPPARSRGQPRPIRTPFPGLDWVPRLCSDVARRERNGRRGTNRKEFTEFVLG